MWPGGNILARDYRQKCLSGGAGGESHGGVASDIKREEPTEEGDADSLAGEDIENLLTAAAEENAR